jgi:hypothetical protein
VSEIPQVSSPVQSSAVDYRTMLHEWFRCRGGASTIPTTAAFLGGIVAQETIKLVTSQYVPLNNTSIVDLVKGGIDKFQL